MNRVVVPHAVLLRDLRELRPGRQPAALHSVGTNRRNGTTELLVRPGEASGRVLLLSLSDQFDPPRRLPQECVGLLEIGTGPLRGRASGFVALHDTLEAIDQILIVGPGMHVVDLTPPGEAAAAERQPVARAPERWSRTIGALGLGVWSRLTSLRYCVIGAGRTGSLVADSLAELGARHITLIDPDAVEVGNLGETRGVTLADLGQPKVEALARWLATGRDSATEVTPLDVSITHLRALGAAVASDLLVTAVDHDGARLAAAAIASLFLKPLLDVGSGIHREGRGRLMGADVRLVLPGSCLLCLGGLRDPEAARRVLSSARAERDSYRQRDWRRERAGSLNSLNQLGAAVALRLLEDFVAERVAGSTWAHAEFDEAGRLAVSYAAPPHQVNCPLCGLCGLGEEGLARVARALSLPAAEGETR